VNKQKVMVLWDNVKILKVEIDDIVRQIRHFMDNPKINYLKAQINIYLEGFEEINKMDEGYLKRGAFKELNGLIRGWEQEINARTLNEAEIGMLAKNIHCILYPNDDAQDSYEVQRLLAIFVDEKNNYFFDSCFFSNQADKLKQLSFKVMQIVLLSIATLRQYEQKRFICNSRDRGKRIKTLKDTIKLAKLLNNHYLISECENTIKLIKQEDFITKDTIKKGAFFMLHSLLTDKYGLGTPKLLHDYLKNNKDGRSATDTANLLLSLVVGKKTNYTPKHFKNKKIKHFFEEGYDYPRKITSYAK
jgi:hypothetical protein